MTIHSLYLVGSFFLVILSIDSTKIGKGGPWGSCRSTQGRDRVSGKILPLPPKKKYSYFSKQKANKFKWYIVISIIGLV